MTSAKVFVPGSIGNVGPGFDVLGCAVEGLGDQFEVELTNDGIGYVGPITGRDADSVPRQASENCAVIAGMALLRLAGADRVGLKISSHRALPLAGGLGASAAASVGGALGAWLALGRTFDSAAIPVLLAAALEGESQVAGRHLDNIAPSLLGGLTIARGVDPPDAIRLVVQGDWWLALASPALRLPTKVSRSVLPAQIERAEFVQQMANTAGVIAALTTGDHELARRALSDHFAEPRRAPLIKNFSAVKAAALDSGALACSISGAGPTVFAVAKTKHEAQAAAIAMNLAFRPVAATTHVGRLATQGARSL